MSSSIFSYSKMCVNSFYINVILEIKQTKTRNKCLKTSLPTTRTRTHILNLTLRAPITTKVVCFTRLPNYLRILFGKRCGPRSDCYYGAVCSGSTLFASILKFGLFAADDFSRHFQRHFFLGTLRVKFTDMA